MKSDGGSGDFNPGQEVVSPPAKPSVKKWGERNRECVALIVSKRRLREKTSGNSQIG